MRARRLEARSLFGRLPSMGALCCMQLRANDVVCHNAGYEAFRHKREERMVAELLVIPQRPMCLETIAM